MSTPIRPARPADAAAIARIYNLGIEGREATFETRPRTSEEIEAWLEERLPVLVAGHDGEVAGFARLSPYSDRCAYEGVAEYGIYLDPAAQGKGIGTDLLNALAATAERAGYHKLLSKLFPSNQASLALARRCGFREVGLHRRHARLDGEWRDVIVVERLLGDAADPD